MTENSKIARENRKLRTNINMPPVDENLYIRSLKNRDIPNDTRLRSFDSQNSKTKKPDIPPRCHSLTTNCKLTTADISTQLSNSRDKV